ncbi:Protocadherin-like wing polarity stan, partial [Paramuricea clavata]
MAEFKIVFVLILLPLLQHITGQTTNQLPYYEGLPNSFSVDEDAEIGFIVSEITAKDPEGEKVTMSLDGIGKDILNIVDERGDVNMTGLSPLTRRLSLKKKLDRE